MAGNVNYVVNNGLDPDKEPNPRFANDSEDKDTNSKEEQSPMPKGTQSIIFGPAIWLFEIVDLEPAVGAWDAVSKMN